MQKQVFGYQTLLVLFVKRCESSGGNFAAPHSEETGSQSGYLQWASLGRTGQQYRGVDWSGTPGCLGSQTGFPTILELCHERPSVIRDYRQGINWEFILHCNTNQTTQHNTTHAQCDTHAAYHPGTLTTLYYCPLAHQIMLVSDRWLLQSTLQAALLAMKPLKPRLIHLRRPD